MKIAGLDVVPRCAGHAWTEYLQMILLDTVPAREYPQLRHRCCYCGEMGIGPAPMEGVG